jgi:hypothetical protein
MKQTTCTTDLCNTLENLKYLENATLCYNGFYSSNTFKCNVLEYYYDRNGSLVYNSYPKSCIGSNNFCLQYVNFY